MPLNNVPSNTPNAGIVDGLTQIIQQNYNPASKYLNLERLMDDPGFKALNSKGFHANPKATKFGLVLSKLIGTTCPDVQTISFASNGIRSLDHFSHLADQVPNLANVSFKDNLLRTYDDLNGFHGKDFHHLHELILEGNPLKEKELEKNGNTINFKRYSKEYLNAVMSKASFPVSKYWIVSHCWMKFNLDLKTNLMIYPFLLKQDFPTRKFLYQPLKAFCYSIMSNLTIIGQV